MYIYSLFYILTVSDGLQCNIIKKSYTYFLTLQMSIELLPIMIVWIVHEVFAEKIRKT